MPDGGWSITRTAGGEAHYITPRSKEAKRFVRDVVEMFSKDVQRKYAYNHWSPHHCEMVGRSWKNMFLLWIWEKIDDK